MKRCLPGQVPLEWKGNGVMKNEVVQSIKYYAILLAITALTVVFSQQTGRAQSAAPETKATAIERGAATRYRTVKIDNLDVFYREAGDPSKPAIVLLHGFPTSSHMFRNLIPRLAKDYYVVAPDYPGFGYSSAPKISEYDYTFENLSIVIEKFVGSLGIKKYSLYLQDYGAPIGYRLAVRSPEKVQALIVQNGNAYDEGLREFWNPFKSYWKEQTAENAKVLLGFLTHDITKWQYTHGTRNPGGITPDNWTVDQYLLDRAGNKEIQLKLFMDYGTNPPLYPKWQAYFRQHQPPTLIVWGKNDYIFPAEGAEPYKRDLKNIEFHLLNTGHFALEEDSEIIGQKMLDFLKNQKVR